ncbi:MAG: rhomboid family intramembrane serine protease [Pirellulales bacterium]|nr:rhomboid family intramembrane serine protease [Pirellulales bacterium]
MGLYDRDYGRSERTAWDRIENPRSITVTLIVINVVIFFVDLILQRPGPTGIKQSILAPWFAVEPQTTVHPWMWWQFLTYGFLHSVRDINHILFNMIGLFFFGRVIEQRLGRMEFLRVYLVMIVFGGVIGAVFHLLEGMYQGIPIGQMAGTIGASGAVVGITVLFACFYPNREVLLLMVFPVKAWVIAVFFVAGDFVGVLWLVSGNEPYSNTAFSVHLAGAGLALLYYFRGWNFNWLKLQAVGELPQRLRQRSRRMKLKLHDPDKKLEQEAAEADRILAKIHKSGESSLTSAERKTLERYSRRQREKRDQ